MASHLVHESKVRQKCLTTTTWGIPKSIYIYTTTSNLMQYHIMYTNCPCYLAVIYDFFVAKMAAAVPIETPSYTTYYFFYS